MKIFKQIVLAVFLAVQAHAAPALTDFWNGQATWVKDAAKIGNSFGFPLLSG